MLVGLFRAVVATQQLLYTYLFAKAVPLADGEVIEKQEGVKAVFDLTRTSVSE